VARILIIDDDQLVCDTLSDMVSLKGHQATAARSLGQGLQRAGDELADVVFLDVRMPDGNGLEAIPALKALPSSPEIIIITGFGDPDGAELAIKHGAWDYLEKSATAQEINLVLARALQYRQGKQAAPDTASLRLEGLVASSPQMRSCLEMIALAARSEAPVLVTGETGTGKELVALAIHSNSPRAKGSFVVIDCAALPPTLAESVLFGHVKGAFTGAERARDGLVKQGDGGTIFMDEVGELPENLQRIFLRVLESGRFRPIGMAQELKSDFRLIAATNRDLDQMAAAGSFREDLLFRLRSLSIHLPPLRQRPEDILPLTTHHLGKIAGRRGQAPLNFSPEFAGALLAYAWPGNVRELIQALERAVAAAGAESELLPVHLPINIRVFAARSSLAKAPVAAAPETPLTTWREAKQDLEANYLRQVLAASAGDLKKASQLSGISLPRLYELLRKHGLKGQA
jgi:two-component system NtrC family response regulator